MESLRQQILDIADQSHLAIVRSVDDTARRAHHRALALTAARIALKAADADRRRMIERINGLRSLAKRAIEYLQDVNTPGSNVYAKRIFAELGEIEKPFRPMADDVTS